MLHAVGGTEVDHIALHKRLKPRHDGTSQYWWRVHSLIYIFCLLTPDFFQSSEFDKQNNCIHIRFGIINYCSNSHSSCLALLTCPLRATSQSHAACNAIQCIDSAQIHWTWQGSDGSSNSSFNSSNRPPRKRHTRKMISDPSLASIPGDEIRHTRIDNTRTEEWRYQGHIAVRKIQQRRSRHTVSNVEASPRLDLDHSFLGNLGFDPCVHFGLVDTLSHPLLHHATSCSIV